MLTELQQFATYYEQNKFLFAVLAVWSIVWKGIALWKSARNNSIPWFVVLLIINLFGVLEILYIFIFSKKNEPKVSA